MEQFQEELFKILSPLLKEEDKEIVLYSGPLDIPYDSNLISCYSGKQKKHALLLLATYGGNANVAYRIARCFKENFESFSVFIHTCCKSAGTLLAIGANELIMSDHAEIGPLDVQIMKADELGERSSGLTINQALASLQSQAFGMFEDYFLKLRFRSGYQITTMRAMDISADLTVGLFAPIYSQIDPMRIGEIHRAVMVSMEYGQRIGKENLKDKALERLILEYPDHGFVIDRTECKDLFKNVRAPNEQEQALANHLKLHLLDPSKMPPYIFNLTSWYVTEKTKKEAKKNEKGNNRETGDNKTGEHPEERSTNKKDDEKLEGGSSN